MYVDDDAAGGGGGDGDAMYVNGPMLMSVLCHVLSYTVRHKWACVS